MPRDLWLWLIPLLSLSGPVLGNSRSVLFIAGSLAGGPATNEAIQARLDQRVDLYAVLQVGRGRDARYHTLAPALRLGGRRISARLIRPLAELGPLRFSWSLVEPHPHHVTRDPPNPGNKAYSNAVLFGPNHGRWLGYDVIEYHETILPAEHEPRLVVRRTQPTHAKVNVTGGLGTMRYKVSVEWGELSLSSPGAEAKSKTGILPQVTRVSFRAADDFVGYLTSYFNVPNVFGSAGPDRTHQAELYQGADCADVIIGAARQAGARIPYSSVIGLRHLARPTTGRLLLNEKGIFGTEGEEQGKPVRLVFGREVQRGDIMLIDYVGFTDSPRGWDHVAVVSRDRGVSGLFDPSDGVLHMGYLYGLKEAEAKSEGPAIVQFLRFTPAIQRAMARGAAAGRARRP